MGHNPQSNESPCGKQGSISHYQLDFQQRGDKYYYFWRHNPQEAAQTELGVLIDLNNVDVPYEEIEKMVFGFVVPASHIISLAFLNCHVHNQQDIKRRLKAGDVKLYSKTSFFTDLHKARQWLEAQCAKVCP